MLPFDLGRGAQQYAAELRDRLDGDEWQHRILTLFQSTIRTFEPDDHLDVPQRPLRPLGLDPRVVLRLRRHLRAARPDVAVAHGGEPMKYLSLASPGQVRLLYYRIGVSQAQAVTGARLRLARASGRKANLVAGVSHETLEEARLVLGVPSDRLRLIPNGRSIDAFDEARTRLGTRSGPLHLIAVGALTPGKRPEMFIDLVARLRRDHPDLRATLIGDGPLAGSLRAPAERAGVSLLGHRSDVPQLLVDADIFCFTSGGESEGMPGVLIEAGMAGLASVATAVPGASTVILDGITGFVTPIDAPEIYEDRVRRLINDDNQRQAMGQAALARCAAEFTLDASAARFQSVLDELAVTP